jgi:hypothetical protein
MLQGEVVGAVGVTKGMARWEKRNEEKETEADLVAEHGDMEAR